MKTKRFCFSLLLLPLPLTAEFTVHEWGTFTQVIASDGTILDGLEREEEPLPSFVHSHAGLANTLVARKGFRRPVKGVNTKMETPVIYFYTDEALQAKLEVKWNGGSISQWYPQRTGGDTPPTVRQTGPPLHPDAILSNSDFTKRGGIDFTKGYDGSINWKVDIAPTNQFDQADLFKGTETVSWLHPRVPKASVITSGSESESYLFYRGIGRLDSGIDFTINDANALTISNTLKHKVPFAMVFQNDGRNIRTKVLNNGLDSGASLTISQQDLSDLGYFNSPWQSTVYRQMREGLMQAGLYQEEAEGMIQTWWSSYFAKPSFNGSPRVFWILPTQQVDKVLPLKITPKPEKTVRVIVGRAEVLRPSFEKTFLAMDRNAQGLPTPIAHDRFALAYRARIQQLESSAKVTP